MNVKIWSTWALVAGMLVCEVVGSAGSAVASPFLALKGTWAGSGVIRLDNGSTEAIRCKAYYTMKASGRELGMSIRCASPSNKIDLRAGLEHKDDNSVSGSWEERTFNANGQAFGKTSETSMRLDITGTLTGTVSVIIDGQSQQVSIFSSNAGLNGVTIRMRRSS